MVGADAGHGERLLDRADRQLEVDDDLAADAQRDASAIDGLEALEGRGDFVVADRKIRGGVAAFAVGDDVLDDTGCDALRFNRHAGQRRTARVCHHPLDRAANGLSEGRCGR